MIPRILCLLAALGVGLARKPSHDDARFFDGQVAPILSKNCLGCHNNELDDGHVSFENRATLLNERGGSGPAVIPGKPEASPMLRAIRHDGDVQMPPGKKLSPQEISILTEWIRRGAPWGTKLRPSTLVP